MALICSATSSSVADCVLLAGACCCQRVALRRYSRIECLEPVVWWRVVMALSTLWRCRRSAALHGCSAAAQPEGRGSRTPT